MDKATLIEQAKLGLTALQQANGRGFIPNITDATGKGFADPDYVAKVLQVVAKWEGKGADAAKSLKGVLEKLAKV